eukprot:1488029-Pleurochrysis_carterae.AAC.7
MFNSILGPASTALLKTRRRQRAFVCVCVLRVDRHPCQGSAAQPQDADRRELLRTTDHQSKLTTSKVRDALTLGGPYTSMSEMCDGLASRRRVPMQMRAEKFKACPALVELRTACAVANTDAVPLVLAQAVALQDWVRAYNTSRMQKTASSREGSSARLVSGLNEKPNTSWRH